MKKYFLILAICCAVAFVECKKEHTKITINKSEGQIPNGDDDDNQSTEEDVVIPEDMESAFPDPIFRAYLIKNFDSDRDGIISQEEAEAITKIEVVNSDAYNNEEESKLIKSLEGIQYLTNLTYLDCRYNHIAVLDVSKNMLLTNLYCGYNKLKALDISKHTQLKSLGCEYCQLPSLDISENMQLMHLTCSNNQLTSLDVSGHTQLIYVSCGNNQLTTLDVSETDLWRSSYYYPLTCAMETLKTLYLKKGWSIKGITEDNNRNTYCILDQTEIIFVD